MPAKVYSGVGRAKDECSTYGTYAACAGAFGIIFAAADYHAPGESLHPGRSGSLDAEKVYLNKHNIPHGVLDITNQRVVYTRLSGDKADFALEKPDIAAVIHRGKIGVNIQAKNGTNYVINIMPPKHVEDALAQMGVPAER